MDVRQDITQTGFYSWSNKLLSSHPELLAGQVSLTVLKGVGRSQQATTLQCYRRLTRLCPSHRVLRLSTAKERGRWMVAAGAAAALTARLAEESLSEGRASERTHCCRTRAAMTEKTDCRLPACKAKKKRGQGLRCTHAHNTSCASILCILFFLCFVQCYLSNIQLKIHYSMNI